MALAVNIRKMPGNVYVVAPSGSLNSETSPQFDQKIEPVLSELPKILVLDLQDLEYLSSAGIRSILMARNALKKGDGKVSFMNLQPQIRKVFDIMKALPSMQIFASVEELDDYLDRMQKKVLSGDD